MSLQEEIEEVRRIEKLCNDNGLRHSRFRKDRLIISNAGGKALFIVSFNSRHCKKSPVVEDVDKKKYYTNLIEYFEENNYDIRGV